MGFTIDTSDFPLIYAQLEGILTATELDQWFAGQIDTLREGRRFATIVDTSHLEEWGPNQRKANTDFLKKYAAELKRSVVGCGLIMTSSITRGVLTAITWIVPFPHPIRYVSSMAEAEDYACTQLAVAGIKMNERWRPRGC